MNTYLLLFKHIDSIKEPKLIQGEVAERLKALVLKTSNGATRSWVRIPPSPPLKFKVFKYFRNGVFVNFFFFYIMVIKV